MPQQDTPSFSGLLDSCQLRSPLDLGKGQCHLPGFQAQRTRPGWLPSSYSRPLVYRQSFYMSSCQEVPGRRQVPLRKRGFLPSKKEARLGELVLDDEVLPVAHENKCCCPDSGLGALEWGEAVKRKSGIKWPHPAWPVPEPSSYSLRFHENHTSSWTKRCLGSALKSEKWYMRIPVFPYRSHHWGPSLSCLLPKAPSFTSPPAHSQERACAPQPSA